MFFKPKAKIEPIHIFELITIEEPKPMVKPKPKIAQPTPPKPPEVRPKPQDPKPVTKPVEKTLAPEPKLATEETVEEIVEEEEFEMELPEFDNAPQLRTVESIFIDPLMQVYLEQLQMILMGNFNHPAGINVSKYAKTSVQFTIQRNGAITGVQLKISSGNATWDRLAMRAINISKLPPLPPNYRAPVLPLVFDFREK